MLFRIYHLGVSPILHWIFGPSYGCRFFPSCSQYAEEAIHSHGFLKGSGLAIKRISRCQPFARAGYDPVPRDIAKPYLNTNPQQGR